MGALYQLHFPSGKSYIGITAGTPENRFYEHCYNSETGRADRAVNRAIRKYGATAVTLKTLVIAEWDYLVELERAAIAMYGTFGCGYNMTAGGEGAIGYRHTPESLALMGAAHKGNKYRLGAVLSEESRAKMSASAKGRKHTAESKAKIGAASRGNKHCLGIKQSPELIAKRAAAIRGKKRTPESIARIKIAASAREAKRRQERAAA